MKETPNVFEFNNYREYLRQYYDFHKEKSATFSYRSFARRAGLNTSDYLKKVIDGKRPITEKKLAPFLRGLKLKGDKAKYFKLMVALEREENPAEQSIILNKMKRLKRAQLKSELDQTHYTLFSHWHAIAIRELVLLPDFEPTPEYVVKKLRRKITRAQAESVLQKLIELGYIQHIDGKWQQSEPMITSSDGIVSEAICHVHREMLEITIDSIAKDPIESRSNNALVAAVSKEKLPQLKEKLITFRKELNAFLTEEESQADDVIQVIIHMTHLTGGLQ